MKRRILEGKPRLGTSMPTSITLDLDTVMHLVWVKDRLCTSTFQPYDLVSLTNDYFDSYTQLPPTPSLQKEEIQTSGEKVEMVTVPALGAEWGKEELRSMTKTGRREKKKETRSEFWKSWNRGERGLCGHYFTRKFLVFFLFGLCVV